MIQEVEIVKSIGKLKKELFCVDQLLRAKRMSSRQLDDIQILNLLLLASHQLTNGSHGDEHFVRTI